MLREGGVEGSGPRPDGARPPHVAAASKRDIRMWLSRSTVAGGVHLHPCGPLTAARRGSQAWTAQPPNVLGKHWPRGGHAGATGPRPGGGGGPSGAAHGETRGAHAPCSTEERGQPQIRGGRRHSGAWARRAESRRAKAPRAVTPTAAPFTTAEADATRGRHGMAQGRALGVAKDLGQRMLSPDPPAGVSLPDAPGGQAGSAWETAVCIPSSHEPAKNGACVTVGGQGNGFGGTAGSSCLNVQPAQFPETIG